MVWFSQTQFGDPGGFGNAGTLRWFRDAPVYEDHQIALPAGVKAIQQRVSSTKYEDLYLRVGGYTENLVVTNDYGAWIQGIRAPTGLPQVALVAGPGITAEIICYESFYDERTDEDSPLSGGTALSPANQQIQWTPQQPVNPRATHVRLWRSVDGNLPRVVMQRQVGVGLVTEAVAAGDLGEASVETFDRMPRGRYNVAWHDRQIVAGDDQNPDTLYLSLIGRPERFSFLTLRTRSRKAITGIFVVNELLVVGTQGAFEQVRGFTEDDLEIEIVKPDLGLASHFSVAGVYDKAWLATNVGPMWTDGSGFFPVHDDIQPRWEQEFKLRRKAYEEQFAVHDPNRNVWMTYVGPHSDVIDPSTGLPGVMNTWWVAGYEGVVPEEGGNYGMPNWSYDVSARAYDCAAVLMLPGGKRGDVYLGACDGTIYRTGNNSGDSDDKTDAGDAYAKRGILRTPWDYFGDAGGDLAHGKTLHRSEVFLRSELSGWTYNIYGGDEDCFPALAPVYAQAVLASQELSPGGYEWAPKWTHPFAVMRAIGRGCVREIILTSPTGVLFAGYQDEWVEGPAPRFESNVFVE